jgi:hypothetical protein
MLYSTARRLARIWLWRLIGRIAFNRIRIIGKELLPTSGPVLFVATHRNGALDAAPYYAAVPNAVPMVSAQLHRLPLGSILFAGIAVARAKDRDRGIEADNGDAVQQCIAVLKAGGQLVVMPEGTSSLGPGHLPFHRGAAHIVKAALDAGVVPTIVPLAVHYEDPTAWQSRVEVLVGAAVRPEPNATTGAIHNLISKGLESVGAYFVSTEEQRLAEALAYACTLGTPASYARALKQFEGALPQALDSVAHDLERITQDSRLCMHQGVPLLPLGPWPLYAAYWLVLAPLVAGFFILNAPVLCAGFVASRKLPDDRNVIAFWRMVAALPTAFIWSIVATVFFSLTFGLLWTAFYWLMTIGGMTSWYRFRKLSVALTNGLFHRGARADLLALHGKIVGVLPNEQNI